MTREQLVSILYRYAQFKNKNTSGRCSLSGYPDAFKTSGWAQEAMEWGVKEGLISGCVDHGQTTLKPQGCASRCQVASIFQRYAQYIFKWH